MPDAVRKFPGTIVIFHDLSWLVLKSCKQWPMDYQQCPMSVFFWGLSALCMPQQCQPTAHSLSTPTGVTQLHSFCIPWIVERTIENWKPCYSWIILGVTMSGQLRRRPNAFNLLHQLEFLERTGMSQEMTVKSLQVGKGRGQLNWSQLFQKIN